MKSGGLSKAAESLKRWMPLQSGINRNILCSSRNLANLFIVVTQEMESKSPELLYLTE